MTTKKALLVAETLKVIKEYTSKLTVRQIYYRLVSRHIIKNIQQEYKYLVGALVDARWNREIPFSAIEDRTRMFIGGDDSPTDPKSHFEQWLNAFKNCANYYDLPHWSDQQEYVEVWLEKQALQGVFDEVIKEWKVTLFPCRGYPSLTKLYEAAMRLKAVQRTGRAIKILYFGDYDPSGQDIPRKVEEDLTKFGIDLELEKIAITKEQIEKYEIPPFPAKTSDPRFAKFAAEYGEDAVELDAIDPKVLQEIIRESITGQFDQAIRDEVEERQEKEREEIQNKVEAALKATAKK